MLSDADLYLSNLCCYISSLIYSELVLLGNYYGGTMSASQIVFPVSISVGACHAVLYVFIVCRVPLITRSGEPQQCVLRTPHLYIKHSFSHLRKGAM